MHASNVQLAAPFQKALDVLCRSGILPCTAPSGVGSGFQLPLERDGPARIVCKVLASHAHHHGRVGIFAIAGVETHAVGHYTAFLAGRCHHLPAGAHAEGVNAPLPHMLGELILAPRQSRMPGSLVI